MVVCKNVAFCFFSLIYNGKVERCKHLPVRAAYHRNFLCLTKFDFVPNMSIKLNVLLQVAYRPNLKIKVSLFSVTNKPCHFC
jgi:hypothetical protein